MSDKPKYRNEAWLREQYIKNGKPARDIADECVCSPETVRRWMKRHGIERRNSHSPADKRLTDETWLREQYVKKERSGGDIADECGCCRKTVDNWIERHGIEQRGPGYTPRYKRLTDKKWLRKQYIENGKTLREIADECGCSDKTVWDWMKRHGIERRESNHTPYKRLTDETWLREQYVKKEKSGRDIADECGCDPVTVYDWMERHGIDVRDCSGENHPDWNGGVFPYGPGWSAAKRRQVRDRDGYECVDCGITQSEHKDLYNQKLHVHHLIKARDINDPEERNAPENLITLCRDCHNRWERLSEAGIRPQLDGVTINLGEHP